MAGLQINSQHNKPNKLYLRFFLPTRSVFIQELFLLSTGKKFVAKPVL